MNIDNDSRVWYLAKTHKHLTCGVVLYKLGLWCSSHHAKTKVKTPVFTSWNITKCQLNQFAALKITHALSWQ